MSDLATLVEELERLPEEAREKARALLEETLALHRQGLQRMLDLGGSTLRESVLHDPLVGALLALHDLHPLSVEQRALAALERSRAELGASSVQVELISAREGVVRVRISGKHADEARESLFDSLWAAAPDATGIEIETVGPVIQLGIGQLGISA